MIDIHAHILPGVDDGAASVEETERMLKLGYQQGIRAVIATPHGSPAFSYASPEKLCLLKERAAGLARQISEDFRIYLGQEIYYTKEIFGRLRRGELLTMAKSDYLLLEFSFGARFSLIYQAVREAVWEGYRPVLAHVERYPSLWEPGRLDELREAGAYLQINTGSLSGGIFDRRTRWCRQLLKEEKIQFLGTDMHNMTSRPPELKKADQWMKKQLSEDYLQTLLWENPRKLLENRGF